MHLIKYYWRTLFCLWIAFVFVQSLFFKFTGSAETRYIFGTLAEWSGVSLFATPGPYVVGALELFASCLLFTRFWAWGALLAFEILSVAILFHLFTPVGVVMPSFAENGAVIGDDSGTLFLMACITCVTAAVLIVTDVISQSSQLRRIIPNHSS